MVASFAFKLVTAITFKKVLIWTLAGIMLVIGYTAYERRSDLFAATAIGRTTTIPGNPVGSIFLVGDTSKAKILALVKDEASIVGLSVVSVDIRSNSRNVIFFNADPTVANPPTLAPLSSLTRLPFLTKNEENNRQMIKLINGEFVCGPYITTILSSIAPAINKEVVTVCYASLPPYYGHFSGFVSILMNTDPTVDEQVRLKSAIESLATEIYFRDVIPTSKRVKP